MELRPRAALALAAALAVAVPPAAAQDRPPEEELFGAPAASPPPAPAPRAEEAAGRRGEDEAALFGAQGSPNALPPPPEGLVARDRDDPLRVGGQAYLRLQLFAQEDTAPEDWPLASPNLLDVYLDVRPNDRVRAFALARTLYDPTLADAVAGIPEELVRSLDLEPPPNPRVVLDQLWLNFDLGRKAFVTAGKQHVKWGVGRFWNPTDFLHRVARDPLDVFDARTGTTMLKVHVPWEARGWNAYGVALVEDPRYGGGDAAGTLGGVLGGGRLEVVLGQVEVGLDALVGEGAKPRWGADVSAGVWELDVHAEAAFGAARARWRERDPSAPLVPAPGQPGRYVLEEPADLAPQVVAGASWSGKYSDEDVVTVGAEWFFQDFAYGDRSVYPFLFAGAPALDAGGLPYRRDPGAFTSFYLGRHYAGAYASLPAPGSWNDTTFTLSAIGNLTDESFIVRLDHSVLALTYLRVETFAAAHLGTRGGEFRLDFDVPPELAGAFGAFRAFGVDGPVVDVGIALRVSL